MCSMFISIICPGHRPNCLISILPRNHSSLRCAGALLASRFLTTANPAASSASSVGTQINHAEVAQSLITNMLPPKVKRLIKVQTHPLDAVAVESKLPWELRVAALIERIPSITPDLHPIEIAYQVTRVHSPFYCQPLTPTQLLTDGPSNCSTRSNETVPRGVLPGGGLCGGWQG